MVLAFEVRRSERIFWKRRARRDLLGVEMRMGKRVWRRLQVVSWHFQASGVVEMCGIRSRINDIFLSHQH